MFKTNLLRIYSRLSQLLGFARLNMSYLYIGYFYHHTHSTYRHMHEQTTYTPTQSSVYTTHTHTHTHTQTSCFTDQCPITRPLIDLSPVIDFCLFHSDQKEIGTDSISYYSIQKEGISATVKKKENTYCAKMKYDIICERNKGDTVKKNGKDLKKVKSLMRKGKGMTTKYDKVDRGREMRLNKEERFREHNLHFLCQNRFSCS